MNRGITEIRNKAEDLLLNILSISSYGVEVILRYNFGERYFNIPMFIGTILTIYFWNVIFDMFGALAGLLAGLAGYGSINYIPDSSFVIRDGYVLAVVILGLWHISAIYHRNIRGVRWHTRNSGISHLTRVIPNDRIVKLLVEPLLVLVIGVGLFQWRMTDSNSDFYLQYPTRSLGLYFITAAIMLFSKEYILDRRIRKQYLDALDDQIENKFFKEKLNQDWDDFAGSKWPLPKHAQGFQIRIPVQPKTGKQFKEFQAMIAELDPNLQNLYNMREWEEEEDKKDDDKGDNNSAEIDT